MALEQRPVHPMRHQLLVCMLFATGCGSSSVGPEPTHDVWEGQVVAGLRDLDACDVAKAFLGPGEQAVLLREPLQLTPSMFSAALRFISANASNAAKESFASSVDSECAMLYRLNGGCSQILAVADIADESSAVEEASSSLITLQFSGVGFSLNRDLAALCAAVFYPRYTHYYAIVLRQEDSAWAVVSRRLIASSCGPFKVP